MIKITTLLCSLATLSIAQEAPRKTQVYLFAGQSNMEGRADADKISAEDIKRLEAVQDRIEFAYNWNPITQLNPTNPKEYIKKKFKLENCFGPEIFFGIALAEANPNDKFLFIKRSQGGTSLYGCWNPNWTLEKATLMKEEKQPKLFQDFIKYTDKVLADRKPGSYEIKAMLWVQGKSDSGVKKRGPLQAQTYGANLIQEVRKHHKLEKLPFLIQQVGGGAVITGMKEAAANDTHVSFIAQSFEKDSPYFLPKNPPPIGHYVTEGMKRIGLNFYKTYAADYLKSAVNK